MELSPDKERFIKLSSIYLDIVPIHLRKLFIKKWNGNSGNQQWKSDSSSGTELFNKLPQNLQMSKKERSYTDKLREGNEKEWDMTVLGKVFLEYGLKLIDGPRCITDRCSPFNDGEKVSILRDLRNQYYAHLPSMSCSSDVFKRIIDETKLAGDGLFEKTFAFEIDAIEKSSIKEEKLRDIERLVTNAIDNIGEDLKGHSAKIQDLESDFHKLKEEKSSHSAKIQDLESDFHKLKEEKSSQKFTGCTFNGPYIENLTTNDTYNHMGHNIDTPTNYMSLNNFATGNQGNVALPQEERPQIENNGGDGSQEYSDGGSNDTEYNEDGTKDLR